MTVIELRDAGEARRFLVQGLCWQRVRPPSVEHMPAILDWALALTSDGQPLPPIGFIADIGHLVFGVDAGLAEDATVANVPSTLLRAYEDHVLGKLLADSPFERAADALRRYQPGDHARGLAFLLRQMHQRIGFPGVLLSPAALKALRDVDAGELLRQAWESLLDEGPLPTLTNLYQGLILEFRNSPAVLGPEDVFELERRTAIAQFGQRVALRQVLQASQMLHESLPSRKPTPQGRRYDVPTHIFEDDTYPVGGFSSISTRGSIESLLHSQLAFMEAEGRPDLFDIKFLRDELLYYSRDENSFLRRRRTIIFALYPDLVQARFKDRELPFQRMIMLLAFLRTAILRLIDWLSSDALVFEFVLVEPAAVELAAEKELLAVLFDELLANGTVRVESMSRANLEAHAEARARRSACQVLLACVQVQTLSIEGAQVARIVLNAAVPALGFDDQPLTRQDAEPEWKSWAAALEQLLSHWV